jgi:hypothetical protein|tara:strand:+ start:154 stop:438 length:285 start_codon:yes stop_codon:yes gene_type:complete
MFGLTMEISVEELPWWKYSTAWLGLLLPISIWFVMAIFISVEIAWISFACGGLIGFFLCLIAMGYNNHQMAKMTIIGVLLNFIAAIYSGILAFN